MAQTRYDLKEYDTKRDLDHVIALDPNYAPAYKLLGKWWEEQEENDEQAAMAYARYVALTPDDPEGRELLSRGVFYAAKISTASSISWKTTSANIPKKSLPCPFWRRRVWNSIA